MSAPENYAATTDRHIMIPLKELNEMKTIIVEAVNKACGDGIPTVMVTGFLAQLVHELNQKMYEYSAETFKQMMQERSGKIPS